MYRPRLALIAIFRSRRLAAELVASARSASRRALMGFRSSSGSWQRASCLLEWLSRGTPRGCPDLYSYLLLDTGGRGRKYRPLPWGEGGERSEPGEGLLRRVRPSDSSSACNRPLTRPAPAGENAGRGTRSPQGRGQRPNSPVFCQSSEKVVSEKCEVLLFIRC